jgi:hypothetical protein
MRRSKICESKTLTSDFAGTLLISRTPTKVSILAVLLVLVALPGRVKLYNGQPRSLACL